MNHLLRELAPVSERAWYEIEAEAVAPSSTSSPGTCCRLRRAGRVEHDAVARGRVVEVADAPGGVRARARVRSHSSSCAPSFSVERSVLDALDRARPTPTCNR